MFFKKIKSMFNRIKLWFRMCFYKKKNDDMFYNTYDNYDLESGTLNRQPRYNEEDYVVLPN